MSKRNESARTAGEHDCREELSSLIDGELAPPAYYVLLERLRLDDAARRDWEWMNAASDALRSNEVAALHSSQFTTRFAQSLAAEPPIVAPRAARKSGSLVRRVVLPGGAVAAAVLVVIALPQLRSTTEPQSVAVQTAPAPVNEPPAELLRSAELEAYLAAHREFAVGALIPRSAPYLRTSANIPAEKR